ncbi:MAG: TonB-dependent hemoglobin/transferrin/lactoferrin family receptor [Halieaceae bacterium]|nr:TonB-dependent hemoglobin/transferrin/lactoferrin family receptor [Halieaceae bacterium]
MSAIAGKKLLGLAGVLGAGVVVIATPVRAQEVAGNPSAGNLETVIVTATRLEMPLSEVSRSIAVIGRQEIETIQPQSVPQTLAYQPNITVAGGPRPSVQSVNIRGLAGGKVLQTVDGARQSFESGHRPSYFLDPELLRSVEAVRGPASSLWGSGALGGVVAQNTIKVDDVLAPQQRIGGFLKTGYNANDDGSTSTGAVLGRAGSLGWLLSGYYRDSSDIEMGNGEKLHGSGSHSHGGMGKLGWQLSDAQELEFIYRRAEWDGNVPANAAAEANDSSNFMIDRNQTTDNYNLGYRLNGDSDLIDLQARAYYNRVDLDETRRSDGRSDNTRQDVYGFNLSNLSRWSHVTLLYGVDAYREEYDARRGGSDRPEPPDARTDVWSAYTVAEIPLAAAWNLELGMRYDDYQTHARNLGNQTSDSATSPSAALVWDAAQWLQLSLRYDEAFRAPGAEELYSTGYHFCIYPGFCNAFAPNPDLKPEQAANTELNAKLVFERVAGADAIHLEASIFENRVNNFIEQVVVGPFFYPEMDAGYTTWVNVDDATLEGGEVSLAYLRGGLALKLGYGQVRGSDDHSNEDLTNVPADTLKADLAYTFDSLGLLAGVRYTYAASQNRTDYAENEAATNYDSYGVADLYASWTPAALTGLRFELNVNNLTDKYYRQAWEQLYQPGRELVLSARYQF